MIRYRIWEELDNHIVKSCILVLVSFFFNLYRYFNLFIFLGGGGRCSLNNRNFSGLSCVNSIGKTREGPVYPHILSNIERIILKNKSEND